MLDKLLESIIDSAHAYKGNKDISKPIDVAILAFVHGSMLPVTVDDIVKALPWAKTEVYERLTWLHSKRIIDKGEKVKVASVGGRIVLDWASKIKTT